MIMSGVAECLAVFDWEKEIDATWWFDLVSSYFAEASTLPDVVLLGTDAEGSQRISLEEARAITRTNRLLTKDIQIIATKPGYKQLVFGWTMMANIIMSNGRTAMIAVEAGRLDFSEVARNFGAVFGPCYGIGYQREFKKGPDLYAYGMAAGLGYTGAERSETQRIGAWFRERMSGNRHKIGMLRDLYPINLLTASHLAQQVEHVPLKKWIDHNAERGSLVELENHQWIWYVPPTKVQNVKERLKTSGLLVAG
jgi:hypothetical protein